MSAGQALAATLLDGRFQVVAVVIALSGVVAVLLLWKLVNQATAKVARFYVGPGAPIVHAVLKAKEQ